MSIFRREKLVKSCPNAVKWLYLLCNFQKFSGGACPRPPLEKFRLRRLLCPSPRKILLFHKISMEALVKLFMWSPFFLFFFFSCVIMEDSKHFVCYSAQSSSLQLLSLEAVSVFIPTDLKVYRHRLFLFASCCLILLFLNCGL